MDENKIEIFYEDLEALSQNLYYHKYKSKTTFISERGREYRKKIQEKLPFKKIEGPIKMTIDCSFKTKRKRDLDNVNKPLIDAIKNIIIEDDDQIYELYMKKKIGCDCSSIRIIIEPL